VSRRPKSPAMKNALGDVFRPIEAATRQVVFLPARRCGKTEAAKQAQFPPDPQRRSMIAKIKIAQKALDFDDGDYRALLDRVTAKSSCTAMNNRELAAVLDEFKRLGWSAIETGKPKVTRRPARADHPAAKKARAMLISLGLLGVIRNASEGALEAFARRQMGVERLQWADQAQVYKLIEALKAIAERHGWNQDVAGLADPIWTLKFRLCGAILRRLIAAGAVSPDATMATVIAARLGINERVQQVTERDLEQLAAVLGHDLAVHAAAAHYED
jgi:phage gp16-like protein